MAVIGDRPYTPGVIHDDSGAAITPPASTSTAIAAEQAPFVSAAASAAPAAAAPVLAATSLPFGTVAAQSPASSVGATGTMAMSSDAGASAGHDSGTGAAPAHFVLPFTTEFASSDAGEHSDASGIVVADNDGVLPDGWFLA